MGTYLWEGPSNGLNIMRCKGKFRALNEEGVEKEYNLQGVGDLFEFREITNSEENGNGGLNKFLFVGRGIDAQKVKSEIEKCFK